MIKRILFSAVTTVMLLNAGVHASADYNIAKGLAPASKEQSISVLQPFNGDFRILGSKIYTDDEHISVNQYDRYLNWKMDKVPVPTKQAMMMVSNMHIIPSNPEIAKQIKTVKRGDLVRLKGELVEIKDKDLVWTSSLTPTDTGDGACEVFRVSSIQWIERVKS